MPKLSDLGLEVADVLLPREADLERWAVVAADQYTSQRDYWQRVDAFVGGAPSTLRLILPEVYLHDADVESRIAAIWSAMNDYTRDGVLGAPRRALFVVDRVTSHVASRKGLVVALDLEHYDYHQGATSLVRATEKTVEERLPSRVQVREKATLELPHVMVLIDDPERTVIEPLAARCAESVPTYATPLMEGGGSVRGWAVDDAEAADRVTAALAALADTTAFRARYGVTTDHVLLYAVGDGNHSLAAGKVHWENVKKALSEAERAKHPARWALVELVNVHDPGLVFEPIHRVVFGVDGAALLARAPAWFEARGSRITLEAADSPAGQTARLEALWRDPARQAIGYVSAAGRGVLVVEKPPSNIAVGSLQAFLDDDLSGRSGVSTDYIHGADVVEELSRDPNRIGFLLPAMDKGDLFKTVLLDGVLPRKTFSMGEADEKRFYLEARKIVP